MFGSTTFKIVAMVDCPRRYYRGVGSGTAKLPYGLRALQWNAIVSAGIAILVLWALHGNHDSENFFEVLLKPQSVLTNYLRACCSKPPFAVQFTGGSPMCCPQQQFIARVRRARGGFRPLKHVIASASIVTGDAPTQIAQQSVHTADHGPRSRR